MERKRIHHIGIVLPNRERAEEFMRIFGFEIDCEEYVDAYQAQCIFTKKKEGEVALEFVIPTGGILTEYNKGKGGLHHIALEVDDVEEARKEFEADGRNMLEESAVPGACGIIVNFLRPRFGAGILVEFVQRLREDSV